MRPYAMAISWVELMGGFSRSSVCQMAVPCQVVQRLCRPAQWARISGRPSIVRPRRQAPRIKRWRKRVQSPHGRLIRHARAAKSSHPFRACHFTIVAHGT